MHDGMQYDPIKGQRQLVKDTSPSKLQIRLPFTMGAGD